MKTLITLITIACSAYGSIAFGSQTNLPLVFEANEGQWKENVRFLARGRAGMVALDDRGAVLIPSSRSGATVRMEIAGARMRPDIRGVNLLKHTTSYFLGSDPAGWRKEVAAYRQVLYRGVYRGIDAVFHSGTSGELEYDFIVHPGGDPRAIRLQFDGAASVRIERGELVIRMGGEPIRMKSPTIYQQSGESRSDVPGRYRMIAKRTVGFVVGDYDRTKDLVIDPIVLGYSTFLGGSDNDLGSAIAVDHDRNIYVAGTTTSANFPTKGGIRAAIAGGRDIFVMKLNPAGDQILFSTFVGGSLDESPRVAVGLDSRGDIYIAGSTSSADFPTTEGAPQRSFAGGPSDAFVLKLSGDGARLLFSTYLGGEEGDPTNGLAVDSMRDIYIGGATSSTRFPVTPGALQMSLRGTRNAYAAKLRVDPPALIYATYLGGSRETIGIRVAVDAAGAAYLTGRTLATDFPTTSGAFQTAFAGEGLGFGDGFISKIDPRGSLLVYSTYLGGESGESIEGITVDSTGAVYLTGITYSRSFPTTTGSVQPRHGGGDADSFVTKLAPAGDRLLFSTYLGSNNSEQANAIAVDRSGNVSVAGTTSGTDFPTTTDAFSRTRQGANDAFLAIFNRDASLLLYSTFLGGTAPSSGPQDNLWAMAVDDGGNIFLAGQTRSTDFPVTASAIQSSHRGLDEVYVTKFTSLTAAPRGEVRVVPVAGSTAGALGSFFRTSVQLHNPRDFTISGRFVFHPQGRSGSENDPFLDYFVASGETIAISDLLPAMSQSGLGSIDLLTAVGQRPESVIRIFNDGGEAGTSGMSEEPIRPEEMLQAGSTGVLIAPPSLLTARFNIGIRTLASGASMTITVRRGSQIVQTTTRDYPPDFFEQRSAADFLGAALAAHDAIALRIDSGSAVVYGATTDNITQDPSLQLARSVDSVSGETRIIPVVGSTAGAFGSFFKTAIQLHNPGTAMVSGRLVYHAQGVPGSAADPSLTYTLQPGQTTFFDDLLPAMNLSGLGSIDLISTAGPLPLSVVRIFNDAGDRGTTGLTENQVSFAQVLKAGDEGTLIAPSDPSKMRFNIGVRTLSEGATITATVRNRIGDTVKTLTKSFPPSYFTQTAAYALLETELRENDTIRLKIDAGSAIVYGATTDNITQDPTLKVVSRLE